MENYKIFNITVTEPEINSILDSLDLYSRIWMGQYENILYTIKLNKHCYSFDIDEKLKTVLLSIRNILFPALHRYGFYASHGIFSSDIDYKAGAAYDMLQEFRYKLAYFKKPGGGYTIDFNPPMKAELDPYPFPKAVCDRNNGQITENITICKEQIQIIIDALQVNKSLQEEKFTDFFSFFTSDNNIQPFLFELNDIIKQIPAELTYINTYDELIRKLENIISE